MPHAVGDSAAFAAVALEGDHADGAGRDADAGVGVVGPGAGGAAGERGEDVGAHEVCAGGEGGVGGAVVYEEDFPACRLRRRGVIGAFALAGVAIGLWGVFGGGVFGLEIVDCFFEHACKTVFFVEGWYDECDKDFCRLGLCS